MRARVKDIVFPGQKSTASTRLHSNLNTSLTWIVGSVGAPTLISSTVPSTSRVSLPYSLSTIEPDSWPLPKRKLPKVWLLPRNRHAGSSFAFRLVQPTAGSGWIRVRGTPASTSDSVTDGTPASRGISDGRFPRTALITGCSAGSWSGSRFSDLICKSGHPSPRCRRSGASLRHPCTRRRPPKPERGSLCTCH